MEFDSLRVNGNSNIDKSLPFITGDVKDVILLICEQELQRTRKRERGGREGGRMREDGGGEGGREGREGGREDGAGEGGREGGWGRGRREGGRMGEGKEGERVDEGGEGGRMGEGHSGTIMYVREQDRQYQCWLTW